MKLETKHIGFLLIITFICFAIPLIYAIYELPSSLAHELGITLREVEDKINPLIVKLITFISIELIIGTTGVFILIRHLVNRSLKLQDVISTNFVEDPESVFETKSTPERKTEVKSENVIKNKADILIETLKTIETKNEVLSEIIKCFEISQAAVFKTIWENDVKSLKFDFGYAFYQPENRPLVIAFGEGLTGQCAKSQKKMKISSVPENYLKIVSGLGESSPNHLFLFPIIKENEVIGVIELSTFKNIDKENVDLLDSILDSKKDILFI